MCFLLELAAPLLRQAGTNCILLIQEPAIPIPQYGTMTIQVLQHQVLVQPQ